jgi:hypothetical protein
VGNPCDLVNVTSELNDASLVDNNSWIIRTKRGSREIC